MVKLTPWTWFLIFCFSVLFLAGCEELDDLAGDEPDREENTEGNIYSDHPDTVIQELLVLQRLEASQLCVKFAKNIQFDPMTGAQKRTSYYPLSDGASEVFMVDNLGKKVQRASVQKRTRDIWGDHNLLLECDTRQYGKVRAFIPRIGGAEGIKNNLYETPPWIYQLTRCQYSTPCRANRNRLSRGKLIASVVSDFVFELYLQLVTEEVGEDGVLSDERSLQIYNDAQSTASLIFKFDHDSYVDWQYVTASGDDINDVSTKANEIAFELQSVSEQYRMLAEKSAGIDMTINEVSFELARISTGKEADTRFSKLVGVTFDRLNTSPVTKNGSFRNGDSSWTEFQNTSVSPDGFSSGLIQPSRNGAFLELNLESNIEKNQGSLQHGFYQEIEIGDRDLMNLYFLASYERLWGKVERAIPGLDDASGLAAISIEYIDQFGQYLGATSYAHTTDNLFSDSQLVGTPDSLSTTGGNVIYRLSAIPNAGLSASLHDEATKAVNDKVDEITSLRVYVIVGDYIGGHYVRHWLVSSLVLIRPACNKCESHAVVSRVDLMELSP